MLSRRKFLSTTLATMWSIGAYHRAWGQAAERPTRVVVGFPPGGSADLIARALVQGMAAYSRTFIVENRPGAGGRIALEYVKNAEPDGSVIGFTPASMLVIYPHIYKRLSYDPFRDFSPVATVCSSPFLITVGPMVPVSVRTLADFIRWCKANPKMASYGSSGAGTMPHFIGAMLARAADFEFTHVAYKGASPALTDLIGGQVAANISVLANALPYVQSGKLRALATTGPTRNQALPNVPTMNESGFKDLEAAEWFGVLLPSKAPGEVVAKLNTAIRDALKTKQLREFLAKISLDPAAAGESSTDFTKMIKDDYEKWGAVVRASGFSSED